jgi:hypothetical protein
MTQESAKREAPSVSPADLFSVWTLIRNARSQRSPDDQTSIAIFPSTLKEACSPNVDVEAVGARTLILDILTQVSPKWTEKPNADKIVEVAARFPLNLPQLGVESNERPFDVRAFMKQIAGL